MASSISAGTTSATALVCTADTTGALVLQTNNGTTAVTIDTSQNVGIGTSSPTCPLTIASNSSAEGIFLLGRASDNISVMRFKNNANSTEYARFDARFDQFIINTVANAPMVFNTNNTERMRIDSSGNVGIGTTSPSTYANGYGPVLVAGASPNWATIQGRTDGPSGSTNGVSFGGSYSTNPINGSRITFNAEGGSGQRGSVSFWTKALDDNTTQPLERMRIDQSGTAMFNTTAQLIRASETFRVSGGTGIASFKTNGSGIPTIAVQNTNGVSVYVMAFSNSAGEVGTISTGSGTTSYNTTSDYRLKENITPMTGALAKVAALKPVTYKWKSDGADGEGFIAHELAEVCPFAVTGAKDALDEEGNPRYQGVDTSHLVATLTAAIQELTAKVTALEARLGAQP